jgi:vitamin B12 transporter
VTSIYALARGEFLDSLTATVAVRRDDHSIFGYQDTYRFTAAAAASERVSFRAAYGTGFRAPSLTELFLEVYGNDNLKPETSESRELGVDWRDEENQLSLTVFSLDVDDIIGYDPATFANRQIEGTSKVLGLEASINWRLSEHLYASANANYTDSDKPLSSGNGGDEREVRVPRRQIQANADYTIDRNSQIGITVRRIEGVVDVGNIKLDDYTLVDLRGDFQITESLKANARLENAFDEEYETVKGFGTPGRAFYVGVSTSF